MSLDTLVSLRLRERLKKALDEAADNLLNGAARTFEDYRERVGYCRGLRDAIAECEEVERRIREGE